VDAMRGRSAGQYFGPCRIGTCFGILFMFSYALGLGLPFLVVGAFTAQASALIGKLGEGFVWVKPCVWVSPIALGILVFTKQPYPAREC